MNNESVLEIIKTRNIFLKEGQTSDEIVLVDNLGEGNMYFTFCLKYISNGNEGNTHFNIIDEHHADIIIETRPNAVTKLNSPYKLGTYEKNKDLLINFVVQPCDADKTHSVTITFYTTK